MDEDERSYFKRIGTFWREDSQFRQSVILLFVGLAIIVIPTIMKDVFAGINPKIRTMISLLGVGLSFFSTETLSKYAFILGGQDYDYRHEQDNK